MRNLVIIMTCVACCMTGFGQTELERILSQKKSLPQNWVAVISGNSKWNITDWAFIGEQSRKIMAPNPEWEKIDKKSFTYQFTAGYVSRFPTLVDTSTTLPAVYFPGEGTFYVTHTINVDGKSIVLKFPFRVYYLDTTKLVLEHLDDLRFDYNTGKILTSRELAQRILDERNKPRDGSANYDATDRAKQNRKGKGEELRMIELLTIKND